MRSFFEDLGKRLGETAETVTNKAGEAMEIQKMKGQIRALERGNDNDLVELGLAVYEQFKAGDAVGEEAAILCEAIQDREASIAEYLQKISDVKGDFQCEECGKTVAKGMAYCPYCGAKTPEDIVKEEDAEEAPEAEEAAEAEETAEAETAEAEEKEEPAAEENSAETEDASIRQE